MAAMTAAIIVVVAVAVVVVAVVAAVVAVAVALLLLGTFSALKCSKPVILFCLKIADSHHYVSNQPRGRERERGHSESGHSYL